LIQSAAAAQIRGRPQFKGVKPAAAQSGLEGDSMDERRPRRKFHPVYLFLVLPYLGMLYVPLFDRIEPKVLGIPFFYWYQMLWTILGAFCILPVYLHEQKKGEGDSK